MSRYDRTPDDLRVPTENSPRTHWEKERKPPASMLEFGFHGHNVMRVRPEDRPKGWMMNDVVVGTPSFPGVVPLVPECTAEDGIPDWAIAEVVRCFTNAEPDVPMKAVCTEILEAAALVVKRYRP